MVEIHTKNDDCDCSGTPAERWVHLEEASRVHDELFPHLAAGVTDRTPLREVEDLREELEREIAVACTKETLYRPWEPSAAL